MKTIHRLAATVASVAITYMLFSVLISEARPPVEGPAVAQAAASIIVAAR